MKYIIPLAAALTAASFMLTTSQLERVNADPSKQTPAHSEKASADGDPYTLRRELYDKLSIMTNIPWHWMAAIDQYERSMSKARPKARPTLGKTVGIFIDEERWAGILNPDHEDSKPASIHWFNGIGRDGDGNGHAERTNDLDLLYSLVHHISSFGTADNDFAIGLWEYYQNNRAVKRIQQFSHIYEKFGRLDLFEHAFPLPIGNNYSYRDTWGYKRSWGGRRSHEGTDIFASHGTPVRSTCYGIVEIKGWNPFGGWRIGIRDLNNYYHYYAHLSGYSKSIHIGDIVEPGQVIGWVGSSGYGKPGTQGKFPPHLHYGVYSDRGTVEWSFDPYPLLRRWELAERKRMRKS